MNNNDLNISEHDPKEKTTKLLTDYTDTVAQKTLYTRHSQAKTLLTNKREALSSKAQEQGSGSLKGRFNEKFDPYSRDSAYKTKRSLLKRWFGKMDPSSLRKGSLGLISGILGTGILVVPQGMAEYAGRQGSLRLPCPPSARYSHSIC